MGEIMKVSYKIGEIEFEAVGDAAFINEQSRHFVEFFLGEYGKQCKPALGQNAERDYGQQITSSASSENGTEKPDNETETPDNGTPAAGEEKKTRKKKRKRLDMGKIMALKRAGWSNKAIAEEMRMTSNAVAVAISTYKKRGQRNECME